MPRPDETYDRPTAVGHRLIGATDVHYPGTGGARAALVVAEDRRFERIVAEHVRWQENAAAYRPGSFATRELPAIETLLEHTEALDLIVIDGYVDLDPDGRPGLGAHLHERIGIPVIGVAKSRFRTATHAVPVHRGSAVRPLYVTAVGLGTDEAVLLVAEMSGPHRIPDALRRVDTLARGREQPLAGAG
jgi:deoxyribonuclease V